MPVKTHKCAAEFCPVRIPMDKLMCRMHWPMVPTMIRCEVNATYRKCRSIGQRPADWHEPGRQYIAARNKAIASVAPKLSDTKAINRGEVI